MSDWLKRKAEAFLIDRDGCPENQWINKRACAHCLEALLREVSPGAPAKLSGWLNGDRLEMDVELLGFADVDEDDGPSAVIKVPGEALLRVVHPSKVVVSHE